MSKSGREMRRKAQQVFRRNQAQFWGQVLKPKPKWVPWFVWRFLMGLVLKIDKE